MKTKAERQDSIEYRHGSDPVMAVREDGQGVEVSGRAAVYDSEISLFWFRESISPEAFKTSLAGDIDVEFLISHRGLPIARKSSGTLKLDDRADGLYVRSELSMEDPDVQRIVPKMERGDLSKMSIGFYVIEAEWSPPDKEGIRTRIIQEAELFDVSIVSNPAYNETSIEIAKRSLDEVLAAEQRVAAVPFPHTRIMQIELNKAEMRLLNYAE